MCLAETATCCLDSILCRCLSCWLASYLGQLLPGFWKVETAENWPEILRWALLILCRHEVFPSSNWLAPPKSFKRAYSLKLTLSEGGSSSFLLLKRMYFFPVGLAAQHCIGGRRLWGCSFSGIVCQSSLLKRFWEHKPSGWGRPLLKLGKCPILDWSSHSEIILAFRGWFPTAGERN